MFLDYYPTLNTIKVLAQNQGLSLVFEDKIRMPRTDGNTIYVPTPDPMWDKEKVTQWLCWVYHEIRHNWPEFRDIFPWMKKNQVPMTSFIGGVMNCLEDHRIEYYKHEQYKGERYALAKGRETTSRESLPKLGADPEKIKKAARKQFGGKLPPDFNIDEQVAYRERAEALATWDTYNRESWQKELVGAGDQMYKRLNDKSKEYVDKLKAGDYGDRMKDGLIDLDTEYQIVKDIIANVFEMDPEEEEKKAKQQAQQEAKVKGGKAKPGSKDAKDKAKAAADAKVMWEDLKMHEHDEDGPSYTSLTIDYSNHKKGNKYVPATPDEIDVYDFKKGDLGSKGGHSWHSYAEKIRKIKGGNIDKKVLRLLQVLSKAKPVYGQKKGRLANRSIHRLSMNDPIAAQRVFKQKIEKNLLDVSVCILCDLSGSMGGDKYAHSAKAALMLNSSISKLGVPVELLGFTSRGHRLSHVIFKKYGDRVDNEQLIDAFEKASDLMSCNADGDSILWAFSRLASQRTKKKILIVLSDGQPATSRPGDIYTFTKEVVKSIEGSPIDIYGIGIEDDNVRNVYKNHTIIHEASQLETRLLDVIKSKVLGA